MSVRGIQSALRDDHEAVIDSVRHLVDPMISSGMSVRGIQSALRDDHEVSISKTTLHTYIRNQRTNSCPR
ncbi:hypothetical protein [Streptomyces sp. NRRL F-5053]|uniref:hypothetical protein n=1 Tax=Streptomyces sp. NRRL F-5053 TaxID=1463854 RepID=UPI00133184E9|nr:hypothetical protein [Streptomyces sp. NRRL F-5053]